MRIKHWLNYKGKAKIHGNTDEYFKRFGRTKTDKQTEV